MTMTIDTPMRVDPEPSSSQLSVLECDPPPSSAGVRWSHSNPESRLLKQQLKDGPVQPQPDAFLHSRPSLSTLRSSSFDLVNPLPSHHPAKAKKFELRQEDSPSMPHHIDDLHSAIGKMNGKVQRNARQKAHKDRRDLSQLDPHYSLKNLGNKPKLDCNLLRREHSFQGPNFPPPHKPPRLQARASEPDITTLRSAGGNGLSTPSLDPSRHISHTILDTLRKPMDIDWDDIPSNTPTPPCRRRRNRSSVDSGSLKYHNGSETSSSPSSATSPLTIHQHSHSPLYSPGDDVSMADQDSPISPVDPPHDSPFAPNEILPISGQPSPEVPSPPALMPPPPPPLSARPDPPPSRLTPPAPTPTQGLVPISLSRPFAPPSQARPTQTQSARPRASQRPRVLGMCRAPGQSSTSVGVNKPYKRPLPTRTKKPPAPAPAPRRPGPHREVAGISTTLVVDGDDEDRRSMSPVIPDPPHIVARAQMLGSQSPALEMSARRPEPRGDEGDEAKDANSSADLWACFE